MAMLWGEGDTQFNPNLTHSKWPSVSTGHKSCTGHGHIPNRVRALAGGYPLDGPLMRPQPPLTLACSPLL